MQIVNIAGYKFVSVDEPEVWRAAIHERCATLQLKGTVVVAPEGINIFLAGLRENISSFTAFIREDSLFEGRLVDIQFKESLSESQPFGKMVVRIAKEIITMRMPIIRPENQRAAAVEAKVLKRWLDTGFDEEGREIVLIDTRNAFEVEMGTFEEALNFKIERFSQFPDEIERYAAEHATTLAEKTIVTFCTGGIRCEKAALFMNQLQLPRVFQLEGGILKYFEEAGGSHWRGDCFVFDERVALDPQLRSSNAIRPTSDT